MLIISMRPESRGDSRGVRYPVNRLHPNMTHLTSRIRWNRAFDKVIKYDESEIIILTKTGSKVEDLESLKKVAKGYLEGARGCTVESITEKGV